MRLDKNSMESIDRPKIGIGSYAYRYNIGFDGFKSPLPMDLEAFINNAIELELQGVQLCENLSYSSYPISVLKRECGRLTRNGMFIELGMRDMSLENLRSHLELADVIGAGFIRVVAGKPSVFPENERESLKNQLLNVFDALLPDIRSLGIRIGLENHYDLPTQDLISIVRSIDDESIGLVFDTTNALGFIEKPEDTLRSVLPYLFSVHVKDYIVEKVEAGYLIRGAVLGEGLLDYRKLLSDVVEQKPDASIILEMTIRREDSMDEKQIVQWEHQKVVESVRVLKNFFGIN
ncbi:MAG: sugar phosphate isomerase/epimerase family protein [Spirochaetota bacterium]|nr:sugar phosphate isomerase/epimerase family protein [Spirochaetota bacterium]